MPCWPVLPLPRCSFRWMCPRNFHDLCQLNRLMHTLPWGIGLCNQGSQIQHYLPNHRVFFYRIDSMHEMPYSRPVCDWSNECYSRLYDGIVLWHCHQGMSWLSSWVLMQSICKNCMSIWNNVWFEFCKVRWVHRCSHLCLFSNWFWFIPKSLVLW